MFLLDTDHIGILQRQTEPEFSRLWSRLLHHPPSAVFFSIVSFHEEVLGWNAYISRATQPSGVIRGYSMFERVLADFSRAQVLPFDQAASDHFAELRKQRIRIATMDLRIASVALVRSFTLLTRNLRDFRKVPSLRAEDWTA